MRPAPFEYLVSEEHFVARLMDLLRDTVVLPKDDKWHEVRVTFDIFCGLPKEGGAFILGGGGVG